MVKAIAWVLNLDAEEELAAGAAYQPNEVMTRRVQEFGRRSGLVQPGDEVLPGCLRHAPSSYRGEAWCPTPRALAVLQQAGVECPEAPALEVLRQVNHRRFAAELPWQLPQSRFVADEASIRGELAGSAAVTWVLKRPFGMAGRGALRVRHPMTEVERGWLRRALGGGDGVQMEPWVERLADFGRHGFLDVHGTLYRGPSVAQQCDAQGAWRGTRRVASGELAPHEEERLEECLEVVAVRLREAGYFGPFGIDGFRWRDAGGALRFHPCSDVNARYSMGWSVGMAEFRGGCRGTVTP